MATTIARTGMALPYLDAFERVTGTVPYTLNVELPGMLHVKLLRSPHAHARIRSVDASAAEAMPGVACVLTGARLPELGCATHYGVVVQDKPVVALDKVRYVGDIVAAAAAVDEDTAAEALEQIAVEYEELPAVFDPEDALRPDAPLLHEELPPQRQTFADIIVRREAGTNLCNHFKLRKGDVEEGFREADEIFEDVYTTPPAQHCPLETHVVAAQWEPDGGSPSGRPPRRPPPCAPTWPSCSVCPRPRCACSPPRWAAPMAPRATSTSSRSRPRSRRWRGGQSS